MQEGEAKVEPPVFMPSAVDLWGPLTIVLWGTAKEITQKQCGPFCSRSHYNVPKYVAERWDRKGNRTVCILWREVELEIHGWREITSSWVACPTTWGHAEVSALAATEGHVWVHAQAAAGCLCWCLWLILLLKNMDMLCVVEIEVPGLCRAGHAPHGHTSIES